MRRISGSLEARDGTSLAYSAWLPQDEAAAPVLLTRTPYGRERFGVEPWTRLVDAGYAYIAVDVRGRGDSAGTFSPWVNDGTDGYDVIEWAASQDWSNGNVATIGGSYDAITQWWAASHHPPHLRCMVSIAVSPLHEPLPHYGHSNGVVMPYWLWWLRFLEVVTIGEVSVSWPDVVSVPAEEMARVAGAQEGPWQQYLDGSIGYGEESFAVDPDEVDVPVLVTNGLWDDRKTFELWAALERSPRARDHRLLVGAWDHAGNGAPRPVLGGVDVSKGVTDPPAHWLAFLDRWMRLHLVSTEPDPRVTICRTGAWRWETHDSWPPRGQSSIRYELPRGTWRHDPSDVVWLSGSNTDLAFADAPLDPGLLDDRADVLVMDLPACESAMCVSGEPVVELTVAQAEPGTVVCWLSDIAPDGSGLRLGLWPTPAHHPGGEQVLRLPLAAINHEVRAGHRLRVSIASSYAPIYQHSLVSTQTEVLGGSLTIPRDA